MITKNRKLTRGLLHAFQEFKILCFYPSKLLHRSCFEYNNSSNYNDILDNRNHFQQYEKNTFMKIIRICKPFSPDNKNSEVNTFYWHLTTPKYSPNFVVRLFVCS